MYIIHHSALIFFCILDIIIDIIKNHKVFVYILIRITEKVLRIKLKCDCIDIHSQTRIITYLNYFLNSLFVVKSGTNKPGFIRWPVSLLRETYSHSIIRSPIAFNALVELLCIKTVPNTFPSVFYKLSWMFHSKAYTRFMYSINSSKFLKSGSDF